MCSLTRFDDKSFPWILVTDVNIYPGIFSQTS